MIRMLPFHKIKLDGGFWGERQKLIRDVTIHNVYRRFCDTGRFAAFKMNWQEGMPNKPHIFWDSDVAKWLESAAYLTHISREPELEAIVDEVVDDIERAQTEDGYFNIAFQLFRPDERFTVRSQHELYCAGHLLEAAIAYDQATGKGKFLALMKKYMSLIKRIFMDEQSAAFDSPGHEEIELALIKLYDYTGENEWLDLAKFFIDVRASQKKLPEGDMYHRMTNIQDHLPAREQFTAEGHAVRAVYFYSAMADAALRCGDTALDYAVHRIFDNIINAKMYITGAIGSTKTAEAFEEEYRLPNDTAYAETCAALGLALFARRMQRLDTDSRYADTVERVIYNGFLSGMSLDGKAFFYENAQEIDLEQRRYVSEALRNTSYLHYPITQRIEVFNCSCCPPNVTRFIPSIADFLYTYTDDTVYIHQYMASEADFGDFTVTQSTGYPYDGNIRVMIAGAARTLALRIPCWCKNWHILKNGMTTAAEVVKGYAMLDAADGDEIELILTMSVRYCKSNPRVLTNRGLTALTYGPFVMCMEGVDNGGSLSAVKLCGKVGQITCDEQLGTPAILHPAVRETPDGLYSDTVTREPFTAKLIPYFAFANRGTCDMRIWIENE